MTGLGVLAPYRPTLGRKALKHLGRKISEPYICNNNNNNNNNNNINILYIIY